MEVLYNLEKQHEQATDVRASYQLEISWTKVIVPNSDNDWLEEYREGVVGLLIEDMEARYSNPAGS